jgi:alpha-D-xyloside xylohydrolase
MRSQVRGLQFAGLSGFPFWGHDAGGFNNWEENHGPDDTMYRQWSMAFGSFTPFWKPHGVGQSRWPLDRPKEVQADAKKYSELRYKMIPYIYTYAHRSYETGLPIARAMVIDHQNELLAWKHDLQYMWGEELLVAPNCSAGDSVSVWLPKGKWFDFWNDSLISGDQVFSYSAPVGKLPLFVKAGSIIPMGQFALSTSFLSKESLTIHVYTGVDASFTLYEDDGMTEKYRTTNEFRTTHIAYHSAEHKIVIDPAIGNYDGSLSRRTVRIVYHGLPQATCLVSNGRRFKNYRSEREVKHTQEGVVWDDSRKTLSVYLKSSSTRKAIVITSISDCP